jgi:hypothetical protein
MARISQYIPKSEREKLQFSRWVLLIINAAEAAGIGRLSRKQLHLLLFLSFASCRFYGIAPLRQRARRTEQGPYYRAAHIALGGLALSGLVEVSEFSSHRSTEHLQFEGHLGATLPGLKAGRVLRSTQRGEALYAFLLDLCLGVVEGAWHDDLAHKRSERRGLERAFEQDLTYRAALNRPGKMLFVEENPDDQETPTLAGLRKIRHFLDTKVSVNRRDVLTVYQRLLMKKAA